MIFVNENLAEQQGQ